MARPFQHQVGDIINGVEILRIYTREDVDDTKRKYVSAACTECGKIRENILPCDLKRKTRVRCNSCAHRSHKVGGECVGDRNKATNKVYALFHSAKQRARNLHLAFDLQLNDITIPEVCPLLGIPLVLTNTSMEDNSPSLDRLIPSKGYVPGNILVISMRANRIKQNASVDELLILSDNLHNIMMSIPA